MVTHGILQSSMEISDEAREFRGNPRSTVVHSMVLGLGTVASEVQRTENTVETALY